MKFTDIAQVLGNELLKHHMDVCVPVNSSKVQLTDSDVTRLCIRYGVLCTGAQIPEVTRVAGRYLTELAAWCQEQRWPPIHTLVVNERGFPGEGFDRAPGGSFLTRPSDVRDAILFRGYPRKMPK